MNLSTDDDISATRTERRERILRTKKYGESIKDNFKDMIDYLPYELFNPIYSFCSTHDLINVACTNKLLYESVKESLWKHIEIPWKVLANKRLQDHITNLTHLKYTRILSFKHRCDGKNSDLTPWSKNMQQNLKLILENCQPSRLKTVTLHGLANNDVMAMLTKYLYKLQKISLYNCKDIDSKAWAQLQKLTRLSKVTIDNCNLNYADFKLIIGKTTVEEVSLSRCNIEENNLKNLEYSVYFKTLKLGEDMGHLVNEAYNSILVHEKLAGLVIDSEQITNDLTSNIGRLRNLHELTLNDAYNDTVDLPILINISKLPLIQSLRLRHCNNLSESCFSFPASAFKSLQTLDVSYCSTLCDDEMYHITKLTSLRHLNLLSTGITDNGLRHIKNLKRLKTLNLRFCIMITDTGIANIGELLCLQKLYLGGCNSITDKSLTRIKNLPVLHKLELRFCTKLTDNGIKDINQLRWIEKLNLSSCHKITEKALSSLIQLPYLKNLNMSFLENLSDAGLKLLKEIKSLQKLNISNCEKVSDKGILNVSMSKSLRCLKMSGCPGVTDTALMFLMDMKLKLVDISSCTGLTAGGISHFSDLSYCVIIS